jgi:hypothetical protein
VVRVALGSPAVCPLGLLLRAFGVIESRKIAGSNNTTAIRLFILEESPQPHACAFNCI